MGTLYKIEEVVIDDRARDGTWCTLPYPNHKKGCPNYGKRDTCPPSAPHFEDIACPPYYAVVETFNLEEHANKMRASHPNWSERQCKNLLYWQGGVRKRLREHTLVCRAYLEEMLGLSLSILEIPEANGVNIFATMAKVDVWLIPNPDIVQKIMLIVGDYLAGCDSR